MCSSISGGIRLVQLLIQVTLTCYIELPIKPYVSGCAVLFKAKQSWVLLLVLLFHQIGMHTLAVYVHKHPVHCYFQCFY